SVGTAFQAAPGVFGWGDVDADGDVDLAVSGDGDDRLFILEQTGPSAFNTRVLQTGYAQAGSMMVVDLNNDGRLEILASSFESDQVRLYVS
ncbi:MAG: FG-GAP repeat domain-containing protein, partial [Actinomycetota bacterium]